MALQDWVRHEGEIDRTQGLSYGVPSNYTDQQYIMLVRDIQYNDVKTGGYQNFPTLYDVALANGGKNYIPVTDNSKLKQSL